MVSIIWLCVGCQAEPEADLSLLDLVDPVPEWIDSELYIVTALAWQPSREIVQALDYGVVIPLELSIQIRRGHGLLASEDRTHHHRFEVRYLPLLRDYELWDVRQNQRQAYPRLSLLLESLARQRPYPTGLQQAELDAQRFDVRVRAHLDHTRLPSPMRLPAWFDRSWRSDGPWYRWIFPAGERE